MNEQTQQTQTQQAPKSVDGVTSDGRVLLVTVFADGHWVSTVDLQGASPLVSFLDKLAEELGGKPAPRDVERFETMTFGPDSTLDLECDRAETWEQALEHHAQQVAKLAAR